MASAADQPRITRQQVTKALLMLYLAVILAGIGFYLVIGAMQR